MLTTPPIKYRYCYLILAWTCLILGIIGAFLPLMPTTVFLLIATWAFSKSSPYWHQWLRNHKTFGANIRAWEKHRAISLKTKYIVFSSLTASLFISAYFLGPFSIAFIIGTVCIIGVAIYIAYLPSLSSEYLK